MNKLTLCLWASLSAATALPAWADGEAAPAEAPPAEAPPAESAPAEAPPEAAPAEAAPAETPPAEAAASTEGTTETIPVQETPPTETAEKAAEEPAAEEAPKKLFPAPYAQISRLRAIARIDASNGAISRTTTAVGRLDVAHLGLKFNDNIGVEAQYAFRGETDVAGADDPKFRAVYFVASSVAFDLFELQFPIGYAENGDGDDSIKGMSYGATVALPLRLYAPTLPNIRVMASGNFLGRDSSTVAGTNINTRITGFYVGLRLDL